MTKILDVTKLIAFADDKLNVTRMMISLLDREENTVGKGDKRAMMAPNCSPESVSPQNEFYLLYYYCSNL